MKYYVIILGIIIFISSSLYVSPSDQSLGSIHPLPKEKWDLMWTLANRYEEIVKELKRGQPANTEEVFTQMENFADTIQGYGAYNTYRSNISELRKQVKQIRKQVEERREKISRGELSEDEERGHYA